MKVSLLILLTVPLAAQSLDPAQCLALRKHGDPGEASCWQRLSRATDPLVRAEGLFGLKDYNGANDAFKAAEKARPKDVNVKVQYGFLMLEAPNGSPSTAADLFNEALEIDKNNDHAQGFSRAKD